LKAKPAAKAVISAAKAIQTLICQMNPHLNL